MNKVFAQFTVLVLVFLGVFYGLSKVDFMKHFHSNIKLVFIPGGCTGEAQPCDVFIQRPFKHALLQRFSEWASQQVIIQIENGIAASGVKLDLSVKTLKDNFCSWVLSAWNKVRSMTSMMETGWKEKCKITNRVFEEVYQLKCRVKWMENKWDPDRIFIPMGKTRDPGAEERTIEEVKEIEQEESGYTDDGEDEEQTTEEAAAECLSDAMIAELLQSEEDQMY